MQKQQLAIGYTRVSTQQQADSGLSLEAQDSAIVKWCESEGVPCSALYKDEGVSGSTPVGERKGLLMALRRATELNATHLVVAKLDRLSRSPFILLTLERQCEKMGVRLVSAAGEGTGDDDPASVLMRRMLQAVSEHELALISARTKAALAEKRKRGEWLGRPPVGFTVVNGELAAGPLFDEVYECVLIYEQERITMRDLTELLRERYPESGWHMKRVWNVLNRWKHLWTNTKRADGSWDHHEHRHPLEIYRVRREAYPHPQVHI
jgi:DNA invertase Pin-like site-specific DNA recombinase|tara:strand:- start:3812 stop:4606 length:795 start_codon:yes stop_codon:yes gene_type:complete